MKQKQPTFEEVLGDMSGAIWAQIAHMSDEERADMKRRQAEAEARKRLPAPVPPEHPALPAIRSLSNLPVEREDGTTAVSLYAPTPPTAVDVRILIEKLMKAFPANTTEFFSLLAERIAANKMPKQRLIDAVTRLIDKHPYREIRIADVLGYDKQLRLYSQEEKNSAIFEGRVAHGDKFQLYTRVDGRPYYVLIADLDKLKLQK